MRANHSIMSISPAITSLASGSSGNAFLVQAGERALLVEAGLPARTIERHLRRRYIEPARLSAIVISHEHHDHVLGAALLARRYGIPLVCSPGTAEAMSEEWKGLATLPLTTAGVTVGGVEVWGFPLPHDAADHHGILLQAGGRTIGIATDLGHAPDHLVECLRAADLVVVEANHDRELLLASSYPWAIKTRILSATGHLSNLQAAELLLKISEDGRPRTVWLAHLSERTNEAPRKVRAAVENYLHIGGVTGLDLHIAERDRPSVFWPSAQLPLFDPF